MAEIDVFEHRLAGAFLRLADDVPGAVDAAAVAHRVSLQHPRRRPSVLPWPLIAVPRPVWILLLAAVLLAALVGGALLAGSRPAVLPPIGHVYACPPGSMPDEPGPIDQAGPPEADSGTAFGMAFDRRAGRLVMAVTPVGGGTVETWIFDVCANTWIRMHPDHAPSAFGWAKLVYDIDSDVTILIANDYDPTVAGVSVWTYDLQADTWIEKRAAPIEALLSLAYDPVSGLVIAPSLDRNDLLMWTYDVESDTWAPVQQANAGPHGGSIAYDASVDRMVVYTNSEVTGDPETWLLDVRSGTWSRSGAKTPGVAPGPNLPNLVYDEAAKRTVSVGWVAVAYDASANRWEMLLETRIGGWPTGNMVYDPVNERLVGPGGYHDASFASVRRAGVFAFDPGTREWTVLLEPGGTQPARTPPATPAPTSAQTAPPSGGARATGPASPMPTASPTSTPSSTLTP